MPVHNALPHLDAAVRSILAQSFSDFEFLIYDDASTDGSKDRAHHWAASDDRIKLFEGKRQLGPALSSRFIAEKATCALVARMDADDLAHPDRLLRQVELLESDREIGLVASLCDVIDGGGRHLRKPEYWRLARASSFAPFPHGSMTYRREIYDRSGGYRAESEYWEDQDLILRMARHARIAIIPEALYQNRLTLGSTRVTSDHERVERAVDLMYRSMASYEQHGEYEALVAPGAPRAAKFDPRVFIASGSLTLWAGGRPKVLRRLLARGRLRPDLGTFVALVWACWAELSPGSLRTVLKMLLRWRNRLGGTTDLAGPVYWSPGSRLQSTRLTSGR